MGSKEYFKLGIGYILEPEGEGFSGESNHGVAAVAEPASDAYC